jgi:hypothetical protein
MLLQRVRVANEHGRVKELRYRAGAYLNSFDEKQTLASLTLTEGAAAMLNIQHTPMRDPERLPRCPLRPTYSRK